MFDPSSFANPTPLTHADTSRDVLPRGEEEDFLKNIATGEESWIYHYDPENKRQAVEYRHPGSPSVKKFKTVSSATITLTIFWDSNGVHGISNLRIGGEFRKMPCSITISLADYSQNHTGNKRISFALRFVVYKHGTS
ncbi:hypothetical protein TNCV_1151541 [Trichonephila clavipes]|nr:hypothetical protein TNCV_1151541 [Trichonephila clavipes]